MAGYRVYWALEDGVLDYLSEKVELGNVTQITLPGDIPSSADWEGVYKIGITAYDNTGNESAMAVAQSFFDFVPPSPPTNLVIG